MLRWIAIPLILLISMTDLPTADLVLFKAVYTATPGSNPEYAQGAIERNELAHREVAHFEWLIQVAGPTSTEELQGVLNEAVAPTHGSFRVSEATEEERCKVESGEITFQK